MTTSFALPLLLAVGACRQGDPDSDDTDPDVQQDTELADTQVTDTEDSEIVPPDSDTTDTDVADSDGADSDTEIADTDTTLPGDTDVADTADSDTEVLVPPDSDTVPADTDTVPADTDTVPADTDTLPADTDTVPADTDTVPAETDTVPVDTDTVPVDTDTVPADTDTLPVDTDTLPADTDSGTDTDVAACPVDAWEPDDAGNPVAVAAPAVVTGRTLSVADQDAFRLDIPEGCTPALSWSHDGDPAGAATYEVWLVAPFVARLAGDVLPVSGSLVLPEAPFDVTVELVLDAGPGNTCLTYDAQIELDCATSPNP